MCSVYFFRVMTWKGFVSVAIILQCRPIPLSSRSIHRPCGSIPLLCGSIPLLNGSIPLLYGSIPLYLSLSPCYVGIPPAMWVYPLPMWVYIPCYVNLSSLLYGPRRNCNQLYRFGTCCIIIDTIDSYRMFSNIQ